MPQINALTLTGIAPATVTYSLTKKEADSVVLHDRSKATPALYGQLRITVRQILDSKRKFTGNYRFQARIAYPVIRTINGNETVVDESVAEVSIRQSGHATVAEKQHNIAQLKDLLTEAVIATALETGEGLS